MRAKIVGVVPLYTQPCTYSLDGVMKIPELEWNQNHEKWGPRFDIWGIQCRECKKKGKNTPLQVHKDNVMIASCPEHPDETYEMPEDTIIPL